MGVRTPFLIAFLIVIIGAGTYWYQTTAAICPVPFSYRLGDIDPSFELTRDQALSYITEAEQLWEDRVGRELFTYDDNAGLSIQFIYDERQATADSEAAERALLDEEWQESEEVRTTLEALQAQYDELAAAYQKRVASYEARLRAYNDEVNTYNDRGGAPPKEYERLEDERNDLSQEATTLTKLSGELEGLVTKINRLAEKGNALIDAYNAGVAEYNDAYGYSREFTQGDYQSGSINIYKFSSDAEVVTVLAHEFGHALGIDHVEGTSSLMYYLLENTDHPPELTTYDIQAFEGVCGYEETVAQKVRRQIRELLAIIK